MLTVTGQTESRCLVISFFLFSFSFLKGEEAHDQAGDSQVPGLVEGTLTWESGRVDSVSFPFGTCMSWLLLL